MIKLVKYTKKNAFNRNNKTKLPPSYPNEMMVKMFSSNIYSNNIKKIFFSKSKKKILEVGSSSGNNLRFFIENKINCFGVEINKEMVDLGRNNLKRLGYNIPEIKIGHNTDLPYPDKFFDCLISINTIHYSSGSDIFKALKEYKRVLKKGSILYIETSGPKHFNRKNSKKISTLKWRWRSSDFRNNYTFGFFSSKEHFKKNLQKHFKNIEIFERTEFSNLDLHFYIGVCVV